ncbi:MAG: hypothetical protein CML29_05020 [Rhizobiales bacterium]|nr:hypothetical protein [Hyphomicrobiales bacterium]MBA71016.1 hypothetical protein [Hyphomicrobiales bacterium]|tara:strand:- start:5682 stop:6134 length:453 start_codon:yes stop_codon:yes gene_type:complete
MSLIRNLRRYRDERHRLIQLGYEIEQNEREYREKSAGLKRNSEEYQKLLFDLHGERQLIDAQIAQIETEQVIRKANFWRVPIPRYPSNEDQRDENWDWHSVYGRHFLSVKAVRDIRREVYEEREMWTRPFLSWGAIVISLVSLAIAFLKT